MVSHGSTGGATAFTDERLFRFDTGACPSGDPAVQVALLDFNASRPAVRELKAWALRLLAPTAGERALDVGSGTGDDVIELAGVVGPLGTALGIEPHAGLRSEADRRAAAAGQRASFVDGDACALPFPDASFDVVRCERVLQHLPDPARAVREMIRVLRPGGRIALIDTDWETATLYPGAPELVDRVLTALSAPLVNAGAGRQLRSLLVEQGVEVLDTCGRAWIDDGDAGMRPPASRIPARAHAAGAITQAEAEALTAEFAAASAAGTFFRAVTMFGSFGRQKQNV